MDPGDVVTPAAYILFYSAIEGQTSLPPLGLKPPSYYLSYVWGCDV